MPLIRDFSQAATAVATGATITIPLPSYELDDVLLALISSDTQAGQTWTPHSGYTQIFNAQNTCGLTAFYKVVTSSLEIDPTFTRSANESFNGVLLSIQNANTSSFFNTFVTASQASAAKFSMPTASLTSGNCLLIYASSNSAVGVPSIIEGPVTGIVGQDGVAESMGVGWSYAPFSGSTTSQVSCSNVSAGAGVKAVIAINAPTTGNIIVPAYCASDSSTYVDPIHGTTAYNGNTAFAATALTHFSGSIGGRLLLNGAAAALADYGINSYHSVGQLTAGTASNTWYGATTVPSAGNRPNVSNKNILVHCYPSNPTQLQRTRSITSSGSKGIGFGIASTSNTDFKIWHTHGTNAVFGEKRTPMIINASASKGLLREVGTLNASSIVAFGFLSSIQGVAAPVWTYSTLWVLDTVVAAGGVAAVPLDIPGIVRSTSNGHERLSSLQQGSTQMTSYGPVQIGDGGTNPVYLKLDATAIEFPEQYNLITKNINYCSIDNVVGITYLAGSSDTIIHKNSIISSPSKFHWRIHPSSSTSATYDFSGLSIIGSGDVKLQNGITFDSMTFNGCTMIEASGTISNCTFNSSSNSSSLTVNTSSMNNISNCIFQNNFYGIQLIQTGSYQFNNLTFISNSFDVYSPLTTGSITVNVNGGTSPTTSSAGVVFNIINTQQLSITSLVSGTEIHVYKASDLSEYDSVESSGTTYTYNYNADNTEIFITLIKPGYKWVRYNNLFLDNDGISIIATQQIDLGYSNPPGP